MNAVLFIVLCQYRNRIRKIFSRPLSAIMTSIAVLFFTCGPVLAFIIPGKGLTDSGMLDVIAACIQLFIGLIMINAFLSQQSGLFTLADTNLLFSTPLHRRVILAYALIQTAPASLLTAVFMCFYFPFVIGQEMSPVDFLATILVMTLFFGCIYLSYYYVYIAEIEHPGLRKKVRTALGVLILAAAGFFLFTLMQNEFQLEAAAKQFFTSPFYNAFPVFGWAKWGIASAVAGNYLAGFLPAVLLLSAFAGVFASMMYFSRVDFFEQAQQDSIRVQELMDNIKSGQMDARKVQVKKVRSVRASFGPGARAILSRQLLEMKKSGPLFTFRELFMGLSYVAVGKVAGLRFNVVLVMLIFSALSTSISDSWNLDFKKPYVYLIPESSVKKVIYSVLPGLIKSIVLGCLSLLAASLAYSVDLLSMVNYMVIFMSYNVLFIFSEVFTYRILGKQSSTVVMMFTRTFFLMGAAIPAGVLSLLIMMLSGGSPALPLFAVATAVANLLESCLLAFLSRKIFEQSELMG